MPSYLKDLTIIYSTACNCNLLPGMHPKMAQNAAGTGFESGAAGLSRGCDYDMDSKRTINTGQIIKLTDKSGNYLIYTGYNWWLKEKNGKKLTGMQCIRVPAGQKLRSGYYMFDSRGCLCKRRRFYRVNTVIGSKRFIGTEYAKTKENLFHRLINVGQKRFFAYIAFFIWLRTCVYTWYLSLPLCFASYRAVSAFL